MHVCSLCTCVVCVRVRACACMQVYGICLYALAKKLMCSWCVCVSVCVCATAVSSIHLQLKTASTSSWGGSPTNFNSKYLFIIFDIYVSKVFPVQIASPAVYVRFFTISTCMLPASKTGQFLYNIMTSLNVSRYATEWWFFLYIAMTGLAVE